MLNLIWPILIVVTANTCYHICAKSMPGGVQPFASLTVMYMIAALLSLALFFITSQDKSIIAEVHKLNWTSLVLGIAIIGLEFGNICIYRAGWDISKGSLVANISLACVLVIVGAVGYKESISVRQIIGMVLCVAGIILVSK
nr:EamA family transporter [bacterium]